MTKEYIEREALLKHIKDLPTWQEIMGIGWRATKYPNGSFDCDDIISSVENATTADVVEAKHGEWKVHPDEYEICASEFVCSCCKESFVSSDLTDEQFLEMMKFCPNCGAKMDAERKE